MQQDMNAVVTVELEFFHLITSKISGESCTGCVLATPPACSVTTIRRIPPFFGSVFYLLALSMLPTSLLIDLFYYVSKFIGLKSFYLYESESRRGNRVRNGAG